MMLLAACGPEPPEDVTPVTEVPPLTEPEYRVFDAEIAPFLTDYYDDVEVFRDDQLTFAVNDGVVTVTGALDSEHERDQLTAWINAVPGVREVRADQVTVGQ